MLDSSTNFVYISKLLKSAYSDFCTELTSLFDKLGIAWEFLSGTKDIWLRDFMPVQLGKNNFWGYKYSPDYLKNEGQFISDQGKIAKSINLEFQNSDIVFDGGNIVLCNDVALICDKVFSKNKRAKNDKEFHAILERELGKKVLIIPWQKHIIKGDESDDIYGHADGFFKYCGGNKILMSNHKESYPKEADEMVGILKSSGFEVEQMEFNVKKPSFDLNWAYINFLQVGQNIIMPCFGIDEDEIAYFYIQKTFKGVKISTIKMNNIARLGSDLHCLTWNIYREQKC